MVDCSTADLVALHLAATDPDPGADRAPYEASIPGIGDAIELSAEAMAERIELLSALSSLREAGCVEEAVRHVGGLDGEHTVYFPTEAGRERASEVRERVADRTVTVRNGDDAEMRLSEVDRYLESPALVRALARLTDDDVLYLDEVGERFVDREAELDRLESHLSAVADGESRAVLVGGEAGVGKTTLVSELSATADREGFRVLEGVCRRDAAEPYLPFRTALEGVVDDSPFPDETALDGAEAGAEADAGDAGAGRERAAGGAGDESGGPEPAPEDADSFEARRTALFASVTDLVDDLADDRPVVVFVDDLHSADDDTLDLFEYVAAHVAGRALLVGTYRPEDLHAEGRLARMVEGWDGPGHDAVELAPFGREEVRGLVRWVLDARELPESFVDLVYDRTGGNPLFVKESVRAMAEEGTVDPDYDVYPADESEVPIPDRVEETVDLRLAALDEEGMSVLQTASLVGETFDYGVLAAAVDLPEPAVRDYVDLLVDGHLWERTDDDRLRFASGLVRETTAARVPEGRRERLHERIARALEERDGRPAAIAHHYREAGDDRRALEQYRRAGESDRAVYAHEAAAENYERALAIARELDDDDAVVDLLVELGEVTRLSGDHDRATDYFRQVRERTDDDAARRQVARYQSRMEARRGNYGEAIRHADRGLAIAADRTSPDALRLLCHKAWALMQQGNLAEADSICRETLERAEEAGDDEVLGRALHTQASIALSRGAVTDEAVERMERAVRARERAGDRRGLSDSLNNLGGMYLQRDELERAQETLERALEINESVGDVYGVLSARNNLAKVYQARGDPERALEWYESVLAEARELDARQTTGNALANAGRIHWQHRHDPETAVDYLERSLEIQRETDNTRWQVGIAADLSRVHAATGDLERGLSHARRSLDLAEQAGMPGARSDAHRILSHVHRERGDHDRALEQAEAALEAADEADQANLAVLSRTYAVDACLALDRHEEAFDYARRARELASERIEATDSRSARRLGVYADVAVGKCHLATGDPDRALELFEGAREGVEAMDLREYEPELEYRCGLALAERGDRADAVEALRTAVEAAESVNYLRTAEKAREALADLGADPGRSDGETSDGETSDGEAGARPDGPR